MKKSNVGPDLMVVHKLLLFIMKRSVMVNDMLSWKNHIDTLCKRAKPRITFLRRLRSCVVRGKFGYFFMSVIMSILQYCNSIWYKSLSVKLKTKLFIHIKICSRIVGKFLEKRYDLEYNNLLTLAINKVAASNQVLHNEFTV